MCASSVPACAGVWNTASIGVDSHPADAQEQRVATAEIDLSNEQEAKEQGGTAATDLQLVSEHPLHT